MAQMDIRYVGIADERTITPAQLREVGVDYSGPTLKWERKNRFQVKDVPVDDALEEVLKGEGHFTLTASKDDGSQQQVAGADNPDGEPDVIVDGNTGAKTVTKAGKANGTS